MMRHAGCLVVVLGGAVALGGCPALVKHNKKVYGNNELAAAKQQQDVPLLSDMCTMQVTVSGPSVRMQACDTAIEILVANKDGQTLADICNLKNPGEKYEKWGSRGRACGYTMDNAAEDEVKALEAADCDTIKDAFTKASTGLAKRPNEDFVAVGRKLASCKYWPFIIEKAAHWGQDKKGPGYALIAALADDGVDWEETFFAYVAQAGSGPLFSDTYGRYFLDHYTEFLVDNNKVGRCKDYIPVAARVDDTSFGPLNWYFRKSNCTAAADTIATRLASDRVKTRIGACESLGLLGTKKKHGGKVEVIAKNDPFYSLLSEDGQGRIYDPPLKIYEVRDACAAALNKLSVK